MVLHPKRWRLPLEIGVSRWHRSHVPKSYDRISRWRGAGLCRKWKVRLEHKRFADNVRIGRKVISQGYL